MSIFFGSLGILGNFSSIYILSRPGLGNRFCHLLIVLAYVDIIYLSLSILEFLIIVFDRFYPDRSLTNLYLTLYPYLFHPGHQITQTTMIILIVVFSLDRCIAVFYPYMVCTGQGILSTFLRGPKRKHVFLYLLSVFIPSFLYSIPHFLEYSTKKVDGVTILEDTLLFDMGLATFYYKLVYYTAMDFLLRIFLPVAILLFTNIRIFMVVKEEQFLVRSLSVNLVSINLSNFSQWR